jgi:hypothetical protein
MFQSLTLMLHGELATLGYPRAALFGFAIALVSYNILSTVQAALRAKFGVEKVQDEVSGYYIAHEVRTTAKGMAIATEPFDWVPFQTMPAPVLAKEMLRWAAHVELRRFKRHPRGPKKPVPKRTRYADKTHVSTARLLPFMCLGQWSVFQSRAGVRGGNRRSFQRIMRASVAPAR